MKPTTLVLGIYFAITCVRGTDLPWVDYQFVAAIEKEEVPEKLTHGIKGQHFRTVLQKIAEFYVGTNIQLYHEQIFHDAERTKKYLSLLHGNISTGPIEEVENQLIIINNLTEIIIEVMPVNATTGPSLPRLPPPKKRVTSVMTSKLKTKNKTKHEEGDVSLDELNKILTTFPALIDRDFAVMYDVMNRFYSAGWNQARKFYGIHQELMKRQFAKIVVPFFLEKFEVMLENGQEIRSRVSSRTWEHFQRLRESLKNAEQSLNLLERTDDVRADKAVDEVPADGEN